MDKQDMKKLLAGLSVAGLIAGGCLTMGGCAATSCSGEKQVQSSSGASGCSGAEKPADSGAEKPAGGSGCSGSK